MPAAISPRQAAAALTEYWSPRVIGELDDSYLKVAKVLGTFGWHCHDDEGELFVVPRGTRHNPVAEAECLILLIERKSTLHTGSEATARTRSIAEQLGGADPAGTPAQG